MPTAQGRHVRLGCASRRERRLRALLQLAHAAQACKDGSGDTGFHDRREARGQHARADECTAGDPGSSTPPRAKLRPARFARPAILASSCSCSSGLALMRACRCRAMTDRSATASRAARQRARRLPPVARLSAGLASTVRTRKVLQGHRTAPAPALSPASASFWGDALGCPSPRSASLATEWQAWPRPAAGGGRGCCHRRMC
jgi:hypothetical protein